MSPYHSSLNNITISNIVEIIGRNVLIGNQYMISILFVCIDSSKNAFFSKICFLKISEFFVVHSYYFRYVCLKQIVIDLYFLYINLTMIIH